MSLEGLIAFQPFVLQPGSRGSRRRWAPVTLSRRLIRLLGREADVAVHAQLTGVSGALDVSAAVAAALGGGCAIERRAGERLPTRGPVLVLVFCRDAALPEGSQASGRGNPVTPESRGNSVTPAALARIVRACACPILPVLASAGPRRARVGTPIPPERVARIADDGALLRWLHARAAVLGQRAPAAEAVAARPCVWSGAAAVAPPVAPDLVEAELAALPREQRLCESGRFLVVQARAHQMPACVREIGRLRELTFRAAGEGTGRALDLDAHDRSYRHLLLFDQDARQIAGAYRFAPTDEILPVFGLQGLYTSTLFRLEPELFEGLGPAIELGRSFVRAEYQRGYAPLLLLWRGLCAFIARSPRYRTLFGAVSVAATYTEFSRALIATTLGGAATLHPLASHVAPRHPLVPRRGVRDTLRRLPAMLEDAAELSAVIGDVEADGKGIPVLLREYLKLGGRLLGFSVDPAFGGVLDGLVCVDLARSPRRLLDAYMGAEAAGRFLAHHARPREAVGD
jgi:putative hemolysin